MLSSKTQQSFSEVLFEEGDFAQIQIFEITAVTSGTDHFKKRQRLV